MILPQFFNKFLFIACILKVKLLCLTPKFHSTPNPRLFPQTLYSNITPISPTISYIPYIFFPYFRHLCVRFTLLRIARLSFSLVESPTYLSSFNSMSFNFYGFPSALKAELIILLSVSPKQFINTFVLVHITSQFG